MQIRSNSTVANYSLLLITLSCIVSALIIFTSLFLVSPEMQLLLWSSVMNALY